MRAGDDTYIGRDDLDEARRLATQQVGGLEELRRGVALCSLPPHPRVLEIGCGAGTFTAMLLTALPTAHIIACDLNERLLQVARAHVGGLVDADARVRFQRADATRLPYAARSFDLVASRCVLMHQSDPTVVVGEMYRVARTDGYALLIEPDWGARATYPDAEALDALLAISRRGHPYGFPDLLMGRKLYSLLRTMGFAPIRVLPTAFAATADDLPATGDPSQSGQVGDDTAAASIADPSGGEPAAPTALAASGPEGLLLQGRDLLRRAGIVTDAELDALAARLAAALRSPDYCVAGLDLLAVGHKPSAALPG